MDRTAYRSAFRGARAGNEPVRTREVSSPVGAGNSTSVADDHAEDPAADPQTSAIQAVALRAPGHIDPATVGQRYSDIHEMPLELRRMMIAGMK